MICLVSQSHAISVMCWKVRKVLAIYSQAKMNEIISFGTNQMTSNLSYLLDGFAYSHKPFSRKGFKLVLIMISWRLMGVEVAYIIFETLNRDYVADWVWDILGSSAN